MTTKEQIKNLTDEELKICYNEYRNRLRLSHRLNKESVTQNKVIPNKQQNVTHLSHNLKENLIPCFDCRKGGIPCYCDLSKKAEESLKEVNKEVLDIF